jgi:hypothetical protein
MSQGDGFFGSLPLKGLRLMIGRLRRCRVVAKQAISMRIMTKIGRFQSVEIIYAAAALRLRGAPFDIEPTWWFK